MPVDIVTVDTSIQAAAIAPTQYNDVAVIGTEAGGTASDNEVKLLDNLSDVSTYFGGSGDIYAAATKIFAQGVRQIYCVRADKTAVVGETVTKGSVQILANFPVHGKDGVTIAATTIEYTTGVPTDPGASKAMVNTKTGQIWINGAGPASVDYNYMDWNSVFTALQDYSIDLVAFAEYTATEQNYGDLDAVQDLIDTNRYVTCFAAKKSDTPANVVTMMANYNSRNVMAIAHKSDDDVGAAVVGRMAVVEPWDKMLWKEISGITTDYYLKSEVTTFETGKVNVVITRGGADRASDGLTTAGGDYKFIDITRTQYYLEGEITTNLGNLIQSTRVPYTVQGIQSVQTVIENACEAAVAVGALREDWVDTDGSIKRGFLVQVPEFSSIPAADRQARELKNVFVTAYLAGHIQTITINLAIVI